MWTITNQQLVNMRVTRRTEFERKLYKHIVQRLSPVKYNEQWLKELIGKHTDYVMQYGFTELEPITLFLELIIAYPLLQKEEMPPEVQTILDGESAQSKRIARLQTYLTQFKKL